MISCRCKDKEYATGVSLDDYQKFFHLLSNINDVDTALTFYHIAGAAIDQCMTLNIKYKNAYTTQHGNDVFINIVEFQLH